MVKTANVDVNISLDSMVRVGGLVVANTNGQVTESYDLPTMFGFATVVSQSH